MSMFRNIPYLRQSSKRRGRRSKQQFKISYLWWFLLVAVCVMALALANALPETARAVAETQQAQDGTITAMVTASRESSRPANSFGFTVLLLACFPLLILVAGGGVTFGVFKQTTRQATGRGRVASGRQSTPFPGVASVAGSPVTEATSPEELPLSLVDGDPLGDIEWAEA